MTLRLLPIIGCSFYCLSLSLSSHAAPQNWTQRIEQMGQLDEAAQTRMLNELSPKAFKALPQAQRDRIFKAALRYSENALGRKANGRLKQVRSPLGIRLLQLAGIYLDRQSATEVKAHAKAGELYGHIPEQAPRVSRELTIDPSSERWHSTGLYAAPGEQVLVRIPEAWTQRGLVARISGHCDSISVKKKSHVRLPLRPQRNFPLTQTETHIASAFGGAIYIDTGNKPLQEPTFSITINHALEAPYFVLGQTSPERWKQLRQAPGAYAEWVTPRVALSFPSEWVRDLDDPTPLLRYWDQIVALHDELGGLTNVRTTPERINVDVAISVGLFHAGYPMQGPQQHCRGVVDLEQLHENGNWGWFHELGHESQRRPDKAWPWNNAYTFDGSVECTVNLFTTHAYDRLGLKPKGGWAFTVDSEAVAKRARRCTDSDKRFAQVDVGTRLAMYLQIRDAFGWEPIQTVLSSYSQQQDENPGSLPRKPQEKRDEFCRRISKATEHNLYPFLAKLWGIEVSPQLEQELAALPTWLPEGFQLK